MTDTYSRRVFGNKLNSTGSTPNTYLYRGEQYAPDLGLYYLRARYMNPVTGRFLSRDPEDGKPVDPATLHKYLYAGGDPVNRIDPRGRADMFETGAILEEDAVLPEIVERLTWKLAKSLLCSALQLYLSDPNGLYPVGADSGPLTGPCWEWANN